MWHKIKRIFRSFLPSKPPKSLGELGELAAAKYLKKEKYKVVDRNVHLSDGELDIVAVDGRTIVFVEVKTRQTANKGEPGEAVDVTKQKKIIQAATEYLNRESLNDQKSRYDIISITWTDLSHPPKIEHWVDAFDESPLNG